jgi:tRNA-dihydrouridine synthase B
MKIGNIKLELPTLLAPMEAVNCEAFMKTCADMKAGMVSTQAIENTANNFYDLDVLKKIRTPVSFQIMTNKTNIALELAKQVEGSVDCIDFNFGCGLKKILGKKAGGYLLQFPHLIEQIVKPVIEEVKTPVSIKIRTGFNEKKINYSEIGKIAETIGASAITLHGRTVRQKYTSKANWESIKKLHQEVSIPVIANGDISKTGHVKTLLEQNYADAVMIGRAAKTDPRVFLQIKNNLKNEQARIPSKYELLKIFYNHYQKQEKQSLHQIQDHASWFITGHKQADILRNKIRKTNSPEDIISLFETHCQDQDL